LDSRVRIQCGSTFASSKKKDLFIGCPAVPEHWCLLAMLHQSIPVPVSFKSLFWVAYLLGRRPLLTKMSKMFSTFLHISSAVIARLPSVFVERAWRVPAF
jgi:uncharacterized membrane protein